MGKFDKYDVFMKMLQVIEQDVGRDSIGISEEQRQKIITVIGKIEGDVSLKQVLKEEISMDTGDKFENISQSVIATRDSIATGIIKVREIGEDDIADALQKLERAIIEAKTSEMSEELKQEALQHLDEITDQASSSGRAKPILKTLGKGLWEIIKNVDSISKTVTVVWPVIESLWT